MDSKQIDQVLSQVLDKAPEVKLRSGKRYAHGRTEPGGLIAIAALKDRIRVSFITEGKGSDVSPERFLEWMNASGILGEKAFDETRFRLREGAKNPHKREVCAEVPYDSRTADDIVADTASAYETLLQKLSGFFEPKVNNPASLNDHTGKTHPEPKEIGFKFVYDNGETQESFEEDEVYTLESDSADLQDALNHWLESRDEDSLKRFAIDLMGDPDENFCETYGAAFGKLLKVFLWRASDSLGWHEVTVTITEIAVDGENVELSEIEEAVLAEDCRVQLVRDAEPTMYMIDCAL